MLRRLNQSSLHVYCVGGGFEGDMIFHDGFDPTIESTSRGVAIWGPRRWSKNTVPYDLSLIASRTDWRKMILIEIIQFLDAGHRKIIEDAMATLTRITSSPVTGKACITFRPKITNERNILKVNYGTGCSATV